MFESPNNDSIQVDYSISNLIHIQNNTYLVDEQIVCFVINRNSVVLHELYIGHSLPCRPADRVFCR